MTPTRPWPLLAIVALFAALSYGVAVSAEGSLLDLPATAPVAMVLLAVAEAGMAKVVADRLAGRRDARGRPRGRPLHPLQIARAAVLAKASSTGGAVLLGGYGGLFAWALGRRGELAVADRLSLLSGLSALAALGLVVAALVLERACRTPEVPDDVRLESPP